MTLYLTIEEAAEQLRMTPDALRRRCARAARKVGRDITAQLGDGIVGVKFGKNWRVRFHDAWSSATIPGACSAARRKHHGGPKDDEERQARPAH